MPPWSVIEKAGAAAPASIRLMSFPIPRRAASRGGRRVERIGAARNRRAFARAANPRTIAAGDLPGGDRRACSWRATCAPSRPPMSSISITAAAIRRSVVVDAQHLFFPDGDGPFFPAVRGIDLACTAAPGTGATSLYLPGARRFLEALADAPGWFSPRRSISANPRTIAGDGYPTSLGGDAAVLSRSTTRRLDPLAQGRHGYPPRVDINYAIR